ncbi:unnamed protein product [Albugo candida]|uniref:DUF4200 domain-containing protein n=1 Tax=Albugo candida TaxID=65357 RepID=A0A024GPX3_9STRA|nr:unnamed protein product [Albugo candida]|eukprot:CCI48606.1 unnamed protein product [Albugo candida]
MNTIATYLNHANRKKLFDITKMRVTESETKAAARLYTSSMVSLKVSSTVNTHRMRLTALFMQNQLDEVEADIDNASLKTEQKGLQARLMSIAHDEDERIFEGYKARLECITHQNKDLEAEELELQKRKSRLIHFYGIQKHETENMHAAYVKFLKNDQELAAEEERMSLTLEQCMELEKQLCRFIEVQNEGEEASAQIPVDIYLIVTDFDVNSVEQMLLQKAETLKDAKKEFSDLMRETERIRDIEKAQLETSLQVELQQLENKIKQLNAD